MEASSLRSRGYRSEIRDTQARRTRGRVLDAATRVFLHRGFAAATLKAVAVEAGVSVPTVEALFGTKARLLHAAIDVAIAGDDEPVAVLDRAWTEESLGSDTADELATVVAGVLALAQARSAGLVLAVFEALPSTPDLAPLADQLVTQRARTAEWLLDAIGKKAMLVSDLSRQEAVDTLWILMDPAAFDRLTRQRRWSQQQYERWFARSFRRLLTEPDPAPAPAHKPSPDQE
jgi:TetR/AcrR family transcriptional regulator of autoinduction and epiphytic fitness